MSVRTFKSKTFSGAGTLQYDSVVPAVSGKVISAHGIYARYSGSSAPIMALSFLDNSGGTELTSPMPLSNQFGDIILPFSEVPWFKTSGGNALFSKNLSGSYGGVIIYSEGNPNA